VKYLFYAIDSDSTKETDLALDSRYSFELWKPTVCSVVPRGFPKMPFAVWWILHHLHVFANRDYSIFVVYSGETIVHRSVILPPYFRFPFMAEDDLQIGVSWTMPEHRGKGLATYAVQKILELQNKPGRRFWYLVQENNIPSSLVAEKAGFIRVGEGIRNKRFGIKLFGSFVMIHKHYPWFP
jgi:RimJ/RimL family protein N-acetyltransferase